MESWIGLGSALGSLAFLYPMVQMYFPQQLQSYLAEYTNKLFCYFYPYIQLTIPEYSGEQMSRSDAYANVESYLAASPSVLRRARKLKADIGPNSKKLLITVGEHDEVVDELAGGMKVWWLSSKEWPSSQTITWGGAEDERRYYRLTFHRRHREFVYGSYLPRVQEEGRAAAVKNRQRRLFTNNPSDNWYGYRRSVWSHMPFEHPSRFDTLAMDPVKKQEIVDDLIQFRDSKEYYAEIGKVWKRGYLLFGPPGTGKSSMIAAMANLLDYDVYDLELTAIKNNTELRKLFIETTGKSIIVIEDIDCSLDLTGKRNKEKKKDDEPNKNMPPGTNNKEESSKVTLSGLLNFIDGLWSACGGERIIVFTTNHVEKLDKALIRRGRMDKHIEMSYCGFEAFKVLAKNYLRVDNHHRFDEVRQLLEEVRMTPADVAENLMPKSAGEDADTCLERLVEELKKAKEEAMTAAAAAAAAEAVSKDGAVGSG
ncbi:AAA-ATPase ASD, mitochondrial-like [Ananas comosus]|uniref:AAA-ATPase ASD, mitochondrial-like n=1 Tax=Ananas comosus TaxID=4615 RepID=A0A6P5FA09_ANACO|nr:AAA-ATPase ASD, mitochondrial-like [Ananas comosus]